MSKKPFTIKFPGEDPIIIDKVKYQGDNGILRKSFKRTMEYLRKYVSPDHARRYKEHCNNFSKKFDDIDRRSKNLT